MILDISDVDFRHIFNDKDLFLPIRWNGGDFAESLEILFLKYKNNLKRTLKRYDKETITYFNSIEIVCEKIIRAVRNYLNGFPSVAYEIFIEAMHVLQHNPLKNYLKTVAEQFFSMFSDDPLKLYRVVVVPDNRRYQRERVFHTPYNLRSKVSTNRYSIAGFPSLYLGTSLELCCEEVHANPSTKNILASLFQLDRRYETIHRNIRVIELGIKPQDFIGENNEEYEINKENKSNNRRKVEGYILKEKRTKVAYLLWYPLIAACSFIRVNKEDPFAAEYIIPQLLMQWVRKEMSQLEGYQEELIGIRYFSCASEEMSELGFNYVFPTYGEKFGDRFCPILKKAFWITEPVYINEYENIDACEEDLKNKQWGKI